MAEKRRLSARDRREPAAKRRASEATPQPQNSSKKKASTPVAPPPPPTERVENPLASKIKDGESLPTLPTPQPSNLSAEEYQSMAESMVLLASLERSKKKWLSDGILERYWTKPKKTKREQIEGKNPPKESMSKIGACNIVIGPHIFDAMLYTVKDPNAQPQYTPPQRQMVHYNNNFQQYQPYPPPSAQVRQHPPYSPAPSAPRQPGYQPGNQHPPPPPHQQPRTPHNPHPPPPAHPHQTQSQPQHQPVQRQSPAQASQTPQTPQPPQPSQTSQIPQPPKPSPDPVIQMLATRAASDPELKALMRVVASSKATQEQLRAFQAHIDELNAIIRAREQQRQQSQAQAQIQPHVRTAQVPQQSPRQQAQVQAQVQAQQRPAQQPQPMVQVVIPSRSTSRPATPSQNTASTPNIQNANATPQIKKEPGTIPNHLPLANATPSETMRSSASSPEIRPGTPSTPGPYPNSGQSSSAVRPSPHPHPLQQQVVGPRPSPQYPAYHQPPYQAPSPQIQSRPPQYGSPPGPYYRSAAPPHHPPKLNYKSVVFEFTSPLTPYGSSTSGHAGSGDRYLFPEYSILEWLTGGNAVIASFLIVRKVDPNAPFPIETAAELASSRGKGKTTSKSKKSNKDKEKKSEKGKNQSTPTNQETPKPSSTPAQTKPNENESPNGAEADKEKATQSTTGTTPSTTATPGKPDSENKPEDAKKNDNPNLKEYYQPITIRIFSQNPKVLEPLARVVKPPDQVRKYMNEIMDRAERAPEGFLAFRLPREIKDDERQVPPHDGDNRDSNTRNKKGGTPIPSSASYAGRHRRPKSVDVDVDSGIENDAVKVEEGGDGEELKDFYGPPTGLVPWGL